MLDSKIVAMGDKAKKKAPVAFVHQPRFIGFIGSTVLANTVLMGAEVDHGCDSLKRENCDPVMVFFWGGVENIFTAIFLLEAIMRIGTDGFGKYIKDGYNRLDFILVLISIFDVWVVLLLELDSGGMRFFSILRVLRVMRVLRLF